MPKVKIAVAGAGLIAQLEHIPNLLAMPRLYDLLGVADPSPATRAFIEGRFGVRTLPSAEELFALRPDAIVIAAPDAFHVEIAGRALDAGIHVFCEKPLAFSAAEIEGLIRRRDAAGRVLQVGYMKRWDPSYEMLAEEVAGLGERLRFIAVECNDPDSWPFSEHQGFFRAGDLDPALIAAGKAKLAGLAEAAVGRKLTPEAIRGYTDSYSSSMIHDLNAVQGLLDRMGISDRRPVSANVFACGQGTSAVLALNGAQAICHLAHVAVPRLADYNERISLFFDDRRFELLFPSPYLNHFPTRLFSYGSTGMRLARTEHRNGFQEAFQRELKGFWSSIVEGAAVRNTAEDARADMALVQKFMGLALREG